MLLRQVLTTPPAVYSIFAPIVNSTRLRTTTFSVALRLLRSRSQDAFSLVVTMIGPAMSGTR